MNVEIRLELVATIPSSISHLASFTHSKSRSTGMPCKSEGVEQWGVEYPSDGLYVKQTTASWNSEQKNKPTLKKMCIALPHTRREPPPDC